MWSRLRVLSRKPKLERFWVHLGMQSKEKKPLSQTFQTPTLFFAPKTTEELQELVDKAHHTKQKLRPVGSGLSPNGIGFSETGMVTVSNLNSVISIDPETNQVTVGAGMRVSDLVEKLKPYGLTLQNFASIAEQQVGGITQVSAHGTGASIPPIDEQVVAMKIVTPSKGTMHISRESHPRLFPFLQVGLGALGIVSEVTLQCVKDHVLVERTVTMTHDEIRQHHHKLLQENLHVKYLWIPYTDCVVVVTCNPEDREGYTPGFTEVEIPDSEKLEHARLLFQSLTSESETYVNQFSFTQLRDELLYINPLNTDHIIAVNRAEAEFWKRSIGKRQNLSDKILGFDCGGEQRVMEVAFPSGTIQNPSNQDLEYTFELLRMIESERIPAPSPLEQRWTARSRGVLSPAHSDNENELFSWLGIIMYLPPEETDREMRKKVNESFDDYTRLCYHNLWKKYKCKVHWAKLEFPKDQEGVQELKEDLKRQYQLDKVKLVKRELDPHGVLDNNLTKVLFSE